MPGLFFRLLRDENQEDWVEEVDDIQPQLDFTITWNKDRLNVPTEEQMVKVFKRFLAATAVCEPADKKETMVDFDDDVGIVPTDIEEDDD
tara:strand:+ start:22 stop:291 length:270 start_codon:yes stop_codon:yes gene_type:complete